MSNILKVVVDSKYTVVQDLNGKLFALRYNKAWRDCVGDNLILSLVNELNEARNKLKKIETILQQ